MSTAPGTAPWHTSLALVSIVGAVLLGRWIPAAISLQHHRGLVWGRKEASAAEPSVHGAEAKLGAGRAPPPRTEREGGWVENESTAV